MTTPPIAPPAAAARFVAVFSRWRQRRGLTKKRLASHMGFDPSYLSHVERGRHRPTADFARRAELVLRTDGELWQAFLEYEGSRPGGSRPDPVVGDWRIPATGPLVEEESAILSYQDGEYRSRIRRTVYNAGTEPIGRWLVRIAVDRYPHDPERSNLHHRRHPLAVDALDLRATCQGDDGVPEPMRWRVKHDRDALKEIWLLFENQAGQFPLYPGRRATIEYGYAVPDELWGPWFQRAVRLPTGLLTVRLDLPGRLDPQVWGVETSLSAGEAPLRTPVVRHDPGGERAVFEWQTESPPVLSRYRLHWRFRPRVPAARSPAGAAGDASPAVHEPDPRTHH